MKRFWLMNVILLSSVVSGIPQETQQMYDISNILNKNDFEKIIQFVLTSGDRATYCNMYNNNPHYPHEEFHIYLNPISRRINFLKENLSYNVSDYNSIVIQDWKSIHTYYHLLLQNDKVYIHNIYHADPESYKNELIKKYIPVLESLIGIEK
jgi:hypothetical protein